MVELVDTLDLKSNDHCDRAGSSPAPSTQSPPEVEGFFNKLSICFLCLLNLKLGFYLNH